MACLKDTSITFEAFELTASGDEVPLNRTFTATKAEADALCRTQNMQHYITGGISNYGIMFCFFKAIYGFTLPSGFNLQWDGAKIANIYWKVNIFRLKRIV